MKILIADDDIFSRSVLKMMLKEFEYPVVEAVDGLDALKKYQEDVFSIVIIDWSMPNMDGISLCKKIRADNNENFSYIILLTAKDKNQDCQIAINAGANDFITKPLDKNLLLSRILIAKQIDDLKKENLRLQSIVSGCPYCQPKLNN